MQEVLDNIPQPITPIIVGLEYSDSEVSFCLPPNDRCDILAGFDGLNQMDVRIASWEGTTIVSSCEQGPAEGIRMTNRTSVNQRIVIRPHIHEGLCNFNPVREFPTRVDATFSPEQNYYSFKFTPVQFGGPLPSITLVLQVGVDP